MLPYILLFAALAHASSTFQPSCSTPTYTYALIQTPNIRSTWDILWSCLFTIFTCTWSVQHLNIPEQRNSRDPGWRGDTKWRFKRIRNGTEWMLLTIVAPELIFRMALIDLVVARRYHVQLEKLARADLVP